jgi:ankyrin repeat protein
MMQGEFGYLMIRTAHTLVSQPASSILARIYLDAEWDDEAFALDLLNVSCYGIQSSWSSDYYEPLTLDYSVLTGALPVFEYLISRGVDINRQDANGHTIGHACFIAENGPDHTLSMPGVSPAWSLPKRTLYEMLLQVFDHGLVISHPSERIFTLDELDSHISFYLERNLLVLLVSMASKFDVRVYDLLVKHGLNPVRSRDKYNRDLLTMALEQEDFNTAQHLFEQFLEQGSFERVNEWLIAAVRACKLDLVQVFLAYGGNPMYRDSTGQFVMDAVIDIAREDLKDGIKIIDLLTPLCVAQDDGLRRYIYERQVTEDHFLDVVSYCQLNTIKLWVESGFSPLSCRPSRPNETAIDVARSYGREDVAVYFEKVLQDRPEGMKWREVKAPPPDVHRPRYLPLEYY